MGNRISKGPPHQSGLPQTAGTTPASSSLSLTPALSLIPCLPHIFLFPVLPPTSLVVSPPPWPHPLSLGTHARAYTLSHTPSQTASHRNGRMGGSTLETRAGHRCAWTLQMLAAVHCIASAAPWPLLSLVQHRPTVSFASPSVPTPCPSQVTTVQRLRMTILFSILGGTKRKRKACWLR